MAKEAYYFSHDANARQDPKILAMTSVYGIEGYGRYWIIVEMLREQSDHTLELQAKYTFHALAMQMQCKKEEAEEFIHDCINEFELFDSDGERFWANSLLRRMAIKEEISHKRKKAAEARWSKEKSTSNADGMQVHSKSNARKGKESKGKESKERYRDYVYLTPTEYNRLVSDYGESVIQSKIEDLDTHLTNTKPTKYKDHNKTLRNWIKRDGLKTIEQKAEEDKPSIEDEYQEVVNGLRLGKDYFKMNGNPERYEELKKERERLEQLRAN